MSNTIALGVGLPSDLFSITQVVSSCERVTWKRYGFELAVNIKSSQEATLNLRQFLFGDNVVLLPHLLTFPLR